MPLRATAADARVGDMGKHTADTFSLQVRISPALQSRLVAQADSEERAIKVIVTRALERELDACDAEKSRGSKKRSRVA